MPAAVPDYLADVLRNVPDVPPGHRHRLYFAAWNGAWDRKPEFDAPVYSDYLDQLTRNRSWSDSARALADRQAGLVVDLPRFVRRVATARSPVVTGVGIEHPSENGFAFFDPHGVPYLPGSSLKGALRRAAEELALWSEAPWDLAHVWWWFGFEAGSIYLSQPNDDSSRPEMAAAWRERYETWAADPDLSLLVPFFERTLPAELQRAWNEDPGTFLLDTLRRPAVRQAIGFQGRLCCWDVFVQPPSAPADPLRVDVMAVHFPGYYQGTSKTRPIPASQQWPDDSEPPIPIKLLVLPAGSSFPVTLVGGTRSGDPSELADTFDAFASQVTDHAFAELSFGAKGSAGYGWLSPDSAAELAEQEARIDVLTEDLSPFEALQTRLHQTIDPDQVHDILHTELDSFDSDQQRLLALDIRNAYRRLGLWDEPNRPQRRRIKKLNELIGDSEA